MAAHLPAPAPGEVLIFTSRHGVTGFCRLSTRRDLPAYAVGCATAAEARRQGFVPIAAGGDAASLLARIAADGVTGPFLHPRGAHVATDIARALRQAGHTAHEAVVYDQQAQPLTNAARATLDGEAPVILPLMSPRSAVLFFRGGGQPARAAPRRGDEPQRRRTHSRRGRAPRGGGRNARCRVNAHGAS